MKYKNESTVLAKYKEQNGNPYVEALPEPLSKEEFNGLIRSELPSVCGLGKLSSQERRAKMMELNKWFQEIDYMYVIYDMIYRAMTATYQSKSILDSIRQLNALYMDFRTGLERALPFSTQAYSGAILGVPGIGKTSTVRRCLNLIPQVIVHEKYQEKEFYTKQINYLMVECPSDCSVKTLVFNILAAIDNAIGSDYFTQVTKQGSITVSALTTKLKIICLNHRVGVIVIDEIQNAVQTAVKAKRTKPLIKFLVELTNETATSLIFCGTLEAEELFSQKEHLKRRTRGLRLLPLKYDITYRRFITELWKYQVTLNESPLTEKLMRQIYDLTAGIPAYVVKIVQEAQIQAILTGTEKVTYETLKQAVLLLGIDVPKYYACNGTSISDFTVREVELEEFESENEYGMDLQAEVDETTIAETEAEALEPVRRSFATRRGRPEAKRDTSDLIVLWNNEKDLLSKLEALELLERRHVSC